MSFKLTKRDRRAYLTIISITDEQRVIQDLPIQLQSPKKVEECEEPILEDAKINLHMPSLKALSTTIDKMKAVSQKVNVTTTSDGRMIFAVDATLVNTINCVRGCWSLYFHR